MFPFLLLFFDVLVRVDGRGGCCMLNEKGRGCITGVHVLQADMALAGCFYILICA